MNSILSRREEKIAITAILIYISVYSLEAPIRYGLYLVGLIEIILLRDLLILGPLAYIAYKQVMERRIHPVLVTFLFLFLFQTVIFYLNYHTLKPALFGAKLFVNVLLGYLLAGSLVNCSGRQLKVIAVLFVLTCAGLFIEKFVTQFPWVGIYTRIGGIDVPISLDWQVDDPLTRRVGGFTRVSIDAACLLPFLGYILAPKCKNWGMRALVVLLSIGGVLLTTQKGALVATLLAGGCLLLPLQLSNIGLRVVVLTGMVAQIVLPFATSGMLIAEGSGGVFTASSFAARVLYTWPTSLKYIFENSIGVFGVGLGGLGGPMRLIVPDALWMYADNMFIFMYGYFGIFAALFYWCVIYGVWRSLSIPGRVCQAPLAVLGFEMWYGTVVTGLEDQVTSLALGATLGCLITAAQSRSAATAPGRVSAAPRWQERQEV